MPLHVEVSGDGPFVVVVHGFTQTCRLWGPFGTTLASERTVIAVDLPGHGGSDDIRADLPTTAELVVSAVHDTVGHEAWDLLGYSLGARVALHVAIRPEADLRRLVLVGATGGIENAAIREARRQSDERTAEELESSGDVEAFLNRWVAGPMFAQLGSAADVEERRRNTAAGLAASLRLAGLGTQEPLWDKVRALDVPLFALAGSDDSRFAAHAFRLAHLATNGVASLVPGGGHAVHLAQPAAVGRLVTHWLAAA